MYFRYIAAIFGLPVTPTSEIIYINPSVLLDPENVWVAVGISLLSGAQAELYVFKVYRPPSWICHFRFLPVWSYNIATTSIG